ncbi:UNVERIFIED_CONTAM: hypothetical protein GTU68_062757 [Idotea baltica]|nr:hypothetical protein [Idotea baltica]
MLEMIDVSKRVGNELHINNVSIKFERGSLNVLLGPTLAGKTSLMRLMAGLDRPTSGDIQVDGKSVLGMQVRRRNVAMVYQQFINYPGFTVYDNIASPMRLAGVDAVTLDKRVREAAELLRLTEYLDRMPLQLSGGQQQRTAIARALVKQAELVLLDEPLANLDYKLREELRVELKELHQRFKHTMIYVTHDQTEALTFADKVVVMYEGEVVQIGTPEELFERPSHTFVGYFIGSPGMNILPCEIDGAAAIIDGHRIPLGFHYSPPPKAKLELGVRPEFVRFAKTSEYGIPVSIERVDDVGRHRIAKVHLAGKPMNVLLAEGEPVPSYNIAVVCDPVRSGVYANDHRLEGSALSGVSPW